MIIEPDDYVDREGGFASRLLLFGTATATEQAAGLAREALKRSRATLKRVYSGGACGR